ncbi:MAG: GGDEF domain-containing protein [Casimicrobiaceae bacterium]
MNSALRHLSLVTQRHRYLVLVLIAVALVDQWVGVALWSSRGNSDLEGTRTLMFGLALVLSLLIILIGAILFIALGSVRTSEFELARLATTDLVTGTLNRRGFMGAAGQEFTRAARYERPLSVLAVDIDHFKAINDAHGHEAGDAVLQQFAAAWQALLRGTDRLGRMGGEEFAILLPETDAVHARELADRVRTACAETTFPFLPAGTVVTVSVGVASMETGDSSIDHALARADRALYDAKAAGRNRVAAATAEAVR